MSQSLSRLLGDQVARFAHDHPNSSVRFAQIIGRRVSHVAGSEEDLHVHECRLAVNDSVAMFVDNGDNLSLEELRGFALEVAQALREQGL